MGKPKACRVLVQMKRSKTRDTLLLHTYTSCYAVAGREHGIFAGLRGGGYKGDLPKWKKSTLARTMRE